MFSLLQSDYLQLSPIGTFPHARGYQVVDTPALAALIKNFNSFLARLGRRFAGVPFYIGHPDVPGYESVYNDRKAYGWIMDLELRDDGLYGRPKWSAAGHDLIANGHFKFLSPYWEATKIGMKDGKPLFRPTLLISVGLTNEPNLPVLPLANSVSSTDYPESTPLLGSVLPLDFENTQASTGGTRSIASETEAAENNQSEAAETNHDSTIDNQSTSPNLHSSISNHQSGECAPLPNLHSSVINGPVGDEVEPQSSSSNLLFGSPSLTSCSPHDSTVTASPHSVPSGVHPSPFNNQSTERRLNLQSSPCSNHQSSIMNNQSPPDLHSQVLNLQSLQSQIALLNDRLIATLLDNAITDTRILPAERNYWRAELETNFESASASLANMKPRLNLHSRTENLYRLVNAAPDRQRQILKLVNERMRSTSLTYDQAWLQTKQMHPELFTP
jgi:hypothetical protein